ncbi:MAG: hypothetical protein GPOALKHO_000171 [Sodalis sp.]|uniref:hypothetical protein n=1 Tax=Sodalis sp. (in: enterobacteria) TaxID=1898979 RepID=UPI003872D290|nr:MAG: hypothetical protein GPOALKHO_000171 [Sodalis sp.]
MVRANAGAADPAGGDYRYRGRTGEHPFLPAHETLSLGAASAMMTGLILTVAYAAEETTLLMLVGVIKSALKLPLDWTLHFLPNARLAFQSQDGDAVQPMASPPRCC